MCEYCESGKLLEDEYGEYEARVTELTPLPAIDLTTGEVDTWVDPPYYALFVSYDFEERGETASFPIKFCPICGRKL